MSGEETTPPRMTMEALSERLLRLERLLGPERGDGDSRSDMTKLDRMYKFAGEDGGLGDSLYQHHFSPVPAEQAMAVAVQLFQVALYIAIGWLCAEEPANVDEAFEASTMVLMLFLGFFLTFLTVFSEAHMCLTLLDRYRSSEEASPELREAQKDWVDFFEKKKEVLRCIEAAPECLHEAALADAAAAAGQPPRPDDWRRYLGTLLLSISRSKVGPPPPRRCCCGPRRHQHCCISLSTERNERAIHLEEYLEMVEKKVESNRRQARDEEYRELASAWMIFLILVLLRGGASIYATYKVMLHESATPFDYFMNCIAVLYINELDETLVGFMRNTQKRATLEHAHSNALLWILVSATLSTLAANYSAGNLAFLNRWFRSTPPFKMYNVSSAASLEVEGSDAARVLAYGLNTDQAESWQLVMRVFVVTTSLVLVYVFMQRNVIQNVQRCLEWCCGVHRDSTGMFFWRLQHRRQCAFVPVTGQAVGPAEEMLGLAEPRRFGDPGDHHHPGQQTVSDVTRGSGAPSSVSIQEGASGSSMEVRALAGAGVAATPPHGSRRDPVLAGTFLANTGSRLLLTKRGEHFAVVGQRNL
jgi:hypothetical protein